MSNEPSIDPATLLSVVVPVYDEEANVTALAREIAAVLRGTCAFEIVFVDDRSGDGTVAALASAMSAIPELRIVRHPENLGQSAALRTGVAAARGAWVATLDGDGQNDPADIPALLRRRDSATPDTRLFAGWRTRRNDPLGKRVASKLANAIRGRILGDGTPDTGCGIKLFEREAFMALPWFDHMHRFLPALMQRDGWRTESVPVNHRPRVHGRSKYNNIGRAAVGVVDLLGVAWLARRRAPVSPLVDPGHGRVSPAEPDCIPTTTTWMHGSPP